MHTLLLEGASTAGGLFTLGKLNFLDMCNGRDGTLLTRGIFEEFYKEVGGSGFEIKEANNFFLEIIGNEPLLTFKTQAQLLAPIMDGNTITGVKVLEQGSEVVYSGKRFIDATADGDLSAMAGASYTYGGEDIGEIDRKMGVTLIFELSGVNWTRVFFHLNTQRLFGALTGNRLAVGATNKIAWGYEEEGFEYVPADSMIRFRGLNMTRQRGGSVLINALVVFDTDPLDSASYSEAVRRAEAELVKLLPYMRGNYAGFRNAELASTADRLYVRETRHIIGEYQLTIDDVLENRDSWDKIAIGSYPADVQPSVSQPSGTVIGNPDRYAVPFRCLIPLKIENLLIVGRSSSYTSLAASSARVVPLGMACGQAAGTAAAQSVSEGSSFRQMSRSPDAVARLQSALRAQGAYLEDFDIQEPIMSHWAYDGMASLRRLGLIGGGYNNDYKLDQPIDKAHFQNLLNSIVSRSDVDIDSVRVTGTLTNRNVLDSVAYVVLSAGDSSELNEKRSHADNMAHLSAAGLIDGDLLKRFDDSSAVPTTAEAAVLLANLYNCIMPS